MFRNTLRTIGFMLFAGLIMPAGMLLATESYNTSPLTSSTANWYDVEQASSLFKSMNRLADKVTKEVGILQVEGNQLGWRVHSARLGRAKNAINAMGEDLFELNRMKNSLEPWQQSLINKITPRIHEMVYQTDEALNRVRADENRNALALSQYPQNIDQIYNSATQMSGTINTVMQYARAEEKMEALNNLNRTEPGS
jgi:type II secretory pathway component GspD/PulD (secretin)